MRRVKILKASGGVRPLGVPTVLDGFIQHAVIQVPQGNRDPGFPDTQPIKPTGVPRSISARVSASWSISASQRPSTA